MVVNQRIWKSIILCEDCHNIFHRIYGHKNNTKSQFLEWMQLDDILLNSSSTNNVKYSRLVSCLEDKRVYNSVLSYCKTHPGLDNSKIYLVCNHEKYRNTAYKKHFFWVDELLELSNDRINEYIDPSGSKKNTTLFTDEDRSIISNYLKYITE